MYRCELLVRLPRATAPAVRLRLELMLMRRQRVLAHAVFLGGKQTLVLFVLAIADGHVHRIFPEIAPAV